MWIAIIGLVMLAHNGGSLAGTLCASCSAMVDQASCQHHIACEEYEDCYVRDYVTESEDYLYDMGCMAVSECPNYATSIIGKRAQGHHVICEACCNNASLCNQDMTCHSIHQGNQGRHFPRDCSEIHTELDPGEAYTIYPYGVRDKPVSVYCLFEQSGDAWTAIQRRLDGSVDFYRNWTDYVAGFGNPTGEYWLGLETIHALTAIPVDYELKILMTDFENVTKYAAYRSFHITHYYDNYRLNLKGYSGTAGDSLTEHNGMMFSTYDQDHDAFSSGNCAVVYRGGWWYENCHSSNLNGRYLHGAHSSYADGIEWSSFHGYYYSLKSTTMMIRKL